MAKRVRAGLDRPAAVPLIVDTPTRNLGDGWRSCFLVWDGEPGEIVQHERRPGFWSITPDGNVAESAQKRRLSDTTAEPVTWHRLEFPTDKKARQYAQRRGKEGYSAYLGDVDRYLMRVLVEDPDFFRDYAMDRPLRVLSVDIEQKTEGKGFPPRDAPMVSIALGYGDGEPPEVVLATHEEGCPGGEACDCEPDDADCVEAWRRAVQGFDPDILAGFNVHYDIGVIYARAGLHGYPLQQWGRTDANGDLARSLVREEKRGNFKDDVFYVGGRIVWDLADNANSLADYSLSGCKDFKLKTIARFLGWDAIEEDTKNTLAVWRERPEDLATYNANDVVLNEKLVNRYLPDRVKMAEFFGAPIDTTIDVMSGWAGTVASARVLYEQGIVSDGKNLERHRDYIRFGSDGPIKFQGAQVAIHKTGLFRPVWHNDFSSLYPHIIVATGCGPDNTRIVGTAPKGEFAAKREDDVLRLSIPDGNYDHNWIIEVRGHSEFADLVRARMEDRLEAKHAGEKDRAAVLKILLNAMFGVNGALHNRYGVWPVSIICSGFSRVLMDNVSRVVRDKKIETDTDGVYTSKPAPTRLLERACNRAAEDYGLEPVFKLDQDQYLAGWFYKAKTYLLLEELKDDDGNVVGDRVKMIGGAFKGSAHPAVFDKIVEGVGGKLLREGREAALEEARKALDLSHYAREDFIQRATLHKPIEAYAMKTKEVKIALAHHEATGRPPKPGSSYEYIRTRKGYAPPTEEAFALLDEYRYLDCVVLPALKRLGFDDLEELGVEDRVSQQKAQQKRPPEERGLGDFGLK